MESKMNIYYDDEGDFLEITVSNHPSESYCEDVHEDVFVRKDENTGEVKSIGIIGFTKRTAVLRELLTKLKLAFPIDFKITA